MATLIVVIDAHYCRLYTSSTSSSSLHLNLFFLFFFFFSSALFSPSPLSRRLLITPFPLLSPDRQVAGTKGKRSPLWPTAPAHIQFSIYLPSSLASLRFSTDKTKTPLPLLKSMAMRLPVLRLFSPETTKVLGWSILLEIPLSWGVEGVLERCGQGWRNQARFRFWLWLLLCCLVWCRRIRLGIWVIIAMMREVCSSPFVYSYLVVCVLIGQN